MSQCENELREFIDLSGIPFLPTPMGRGVISDDHVLSVAAERSRALGEADVVLLLGCRLNWILHFGEPPRWRTDVQFIAIDLDRSLEELEKVIDVQFSLILLELYYRFRSTFSCSVMSNQLLIYSTFMVLRFN